MQTYESFGYVCMMPSQKKVFNMPPILYITLFNTLFPSKSYHKRNKIRNILTV